MTKAWHADELAALQACLREQGDAVDWDDVARQLPRFAGFPVRTGRAAKKQAERFGVWDVRSVRVFANRCQFNVLGQRTSASQHSGGTTKACKLGDIILSQHV